MVGIYLLPPFSPTLPSLPSLPSSLPSHSSLLPFSPLHFFSLPPIIRKRAREKYIIVGREEIEPYSERFTDQLRVVCVHCTVQILFLHGIIVHANHIIACYAVYPLYFSLTIVFSNAADLKFSMSKVVMFSLFSFYSISYSSCFSYVYTLFLSTSHFHLLRATMYAQLAATFSSIKTSRHTTKLSSLV